MPAPWPHEGIRVPVAEGSHGFFEWLMISAKARAQVDVKCGRWYVEYRARFIIQLFGFVLIAELLLRYLKPWWEHHQYCLSSSFYPSVLLPPSWLISS